MGLHRYKINCDCASYTWTRNPPKKGVLFMRCRGCHKPLGDLQVTYIGPVAKDDPRNQV
jgi:hypothetical protein